MIISTPLTLLLALIALLFAGAPAAAQAPGPRHLAIELVAETTAVPAGGTVTVALASRPEPGWHGYWANPGDAGFAPTFDWRMPTGVTASAPDYPVPSTLLIAGLMNYVYERPYAPLVELRVPAGLAAGTRLPVRLDLQYLVCTRELCVPERNSLSLDLVVGAPQAREPRFDGWRRATPKPIGAPATWAAKNGDARLSIPYPADAPLDRAYFFPLTDKRLDYAAPQTVSRDGDRVIVATKAGSEPQGALDGVLRIGPDRGLVVHVTPGAVPSASGASPWTAALLAFAGAVLGGLVLNVMPCVFPILSLKAISLAKSGAGAREARTEALAYTAGVVGVCVALGAVILGLRAGGAQVGWAFQLQDLRMLLLLLLLSAAIGFNLAGLFELPTPSVGRWSGASGALATGALAAVVATPCSGPFMAAALGSALVLPWPAALAVFAGLGLGLALPFLLIGFVPALRRRLPRPGPWMATARRVLAVPMFLTAIALGWVLGRQAGVDGLTLALIALLANALLLWAGGRRQLAGRAFGWPLAGVALLVSGGAAAVVSRAPAVATVGGGEQRFSEARLASLQAERRPVFVYFTADWCLTCKVNERAAIDTAGVRTAFGKAGVAVLKGDWTDGDPVMGRFIERHNRAGVPLYLYYAPGSAEPRVLPQLLTPATLTSLAR